jgi:predicted ATPase with chaperone activity
MNPLFAPTRGVTSINSQKKRTWVFSNPEVLKKMLLHRIIFLSAMHKSAVPYKDLMTESYAQPSKDIRRRVSSARDIKSQRFARTIADLEGNQDIQVDHISEANQYSNLDRGVSLNRKTA